MSRWTRILMAALALFVFLGAVMSGYLNSDTLSLIHISEPTRP